ncbi:MAG: murein biosynthesis integral membrane protein MurJ [Candidatus Daviesbacteria bacterium]|nr:MAG: murein biosynthesis integral membrane protein MurJ [Candidatus Daviesbacteria bacterium]
MVKFLQLLTAKQTSILSGALVIMGTVILSKILGLIRDRLLVHTFPPDTVAIFFAAFRLPDLIFQLLIFGALSVAFIPVFTQYLEERGRAEAFRLAQSILIIALAVLSVAALLVFFFSDIVTGWIVPGFTPAQKIQVAQLTRAILVGQILLVMGSFFVGILQSYQRFIIPALAGVFYNLGIILGVIFLSDSLGILAAGMGVIMGAAMHALIQLPLVWSLGFRIGSLKSLIHPGVKEIFQLMSIRTLGLAAEQINETVGVVLASLISTASVTYLTFAQHLQVVPIGLFGATIAQAALPVLATEKSRGQKEEFKATLLTTLHQILFLSLPSTAILIILRIPAVRLVFGASQFDWTATVSTGMTLAFLAIGLAAQAASLLLVRGFYALRDTKTPVLVSFIVVGVNIVLSIYFINILHLPVWGLGLANSIAAVLSGLLLFFTLHFKIGGFNLRQVWGPFSKMLLSTIIMAGALYIPIKLLDQVIFDTTRTINLIILTGLASAFALSIYIILVWFLKVRELQTYVELLKRLTKLQSKIRSKEIVETAEQV